jgi:hypothetical protein
MQQNPLKHNHSLISIVFVGYALPLIFLSFFAVWAVDWKSPWSIFPLGLIISSVGTCVIYLQFLRNRNVSVVMTEEVVQPIDSEYIEAVEKKAAEAELQSLQLQTMIENLNKRVNEVEIERESLRVAIETTQKEYGVYKHDASMLLEQNRVLLNEYQSTIQDQREMLDKKQQHILQLDNKVHDLSYEIKALVQVESYEGLLVSAGGGSSKVIQHPGMSHSEAVYKTLPPPPPPSQLEEVVFTKKNGDTSDAHRLLQRCIDIAQKITGASYYNSSSAARSRDLPSDHYAFDLRRLCESLRSESGGMILIYSQKDHKPLFVNDSVKEFTGWTADKFLMNFAEIIQPSQGAWSNVLQQMSFKNQVVQNLHLKNRNGSDNEFKAEIGLIPTGVFRNNLIVVFNVASV